MFRKKSDNKNQVVKKPVVKNRNYHAPDNVLIFTFVLALTVGLVLLFSASSVAAYIRSGSSLYFLKHQLLAIIIGIPLFLFLSRFDYHKYRQMSTAFLIVSVGLLILTFIPGLGAGYGKANNWINFYGFSMQPSEFVKVLFALYLAAFLDTNKDKLHDFAESFMPFMVAFAPIAILIMMQPDFGTLLIIFGASIVSYFVAGAPKKFFVIGIFVALIGITLLVNIKSSKMDRIECYLHPEIGAADKCYQVQQSLIAIGSGGFWGRGLGESRQKFMYLPEVWSDSIFPVVAEELGFIFSILVIAIFFLLFWRGIKVAQAAPDLYGKLMATGLASWIMVQAMLNIGAAINLIPMTGVPMPFTSAGGSSILALMATTGILVNISRQTK
ncbi:MAG: putative lipid II flippase FtsW [Candidatus Falkowbacteria bacterium]